VAGELDLSRLLAGLSPNLRDGEYVFCTFAGGQYGEHGELSPLAAFQEDEGMTLVVPRAKAEAAGGYYDGVFRCITLEVQSSLDAVGLTAAVSQALASAGIPANVIAAYHHDHVFVPAPRADEALAALRVLAL